MAEITKNNESNPEVDPALPGEALPTVEIDLEGFSAQEVDGLLRVKQAIEHGHYSDVTDEHRKLLFAKWLFEHDRLSS